MSREAQVFLLGPQYRKPNLEEVFSSIELPDGPVAVVTAGFQDREGECGEEFQFLQGHYFDLELYRRADRVFQKDPNFREAHREMQRVLREIERLYDARLSYLIQSVRQLLSDRANRGLLGPEQEHAMEQLRALDTWHLQRITEIRSEFLDKWNPTGRDAVKEERDELEKLLSPVSAVVITGGHVAVLLNRLRLFDMKPLLMNKTLLAWSAGAMVLTEQVVLFHDHPPQGPGNPEVIDRGLGLCPGLVVLPDGEKRLDLKDPERVASFARRFHPDACIVLETGDSISWNRQCWVAKEAVTRLGTAGLVESVVSW